MKYLTIALAICLVALAISIRSCANIKADRNRLSDNQQALFEDVDYYRTQSGHSAASVERLTLSKAEVDKYCQDLKVSLAQLNIKVKRLQSASTSATETKYNIKTNVRDSLVVRDSIVVDTLRCISYRDAWLSFAGCTNDGVNYDVNIESRDTLTTIVHRVPRKFLFIKYGCKAIRQEVLSKNPHTKITYTQYIELK